MQQGSCLLVTLYAFCRIYSLSGFSAPRTLPPLPLVSSPMLRLQIPLYHVSIYLVVYIFTYARILHRCHSNPHVKHAFAATVQNRRVPRLATNASAAGYGLSANNPPRRMSSLTAGGCFRGAERSITDYSPGRINGNSP